MCVPVGPCNIITDIFTQPLCAGEVGGRIVSSRGKWHLCSLRAAELIAPMKREGEKGCPGMGWAF